MNNIPAFQNQGGSGNLWNDKGMTLRDYFAAQAMPAILAQMDVCNGKDLTNSAWIAYQMADAMMKAREA
jgi:hypothetical protein